MTIDGFVITALHQELQNNLVPARVNRVFQTSDHELVLALRQPGETIHLLLSCHPRFARIHTTSREGKKLPTPPRFSLLLRKHLEGSRLVAINRPGFERILEFFFQTRSELGEPVTRVLIVELMGKHSNIIFRQSPEGPILDSIIHVTEAMSRFRQILPGRPYLPPPAQDKADPRAVRELTFYSLLKAREQGLDKALVSTFAGLSPLLARELACRAELAPSFPIKDMNRQDLKGLWEVFYHLVGLLKQGRTQPTVVFNEKGFPLAFSIFPLQQYHDYSQESFATVSQAIDYYYHHKEEEQRLEREKNRLGQLVKKEQKKLKTTMARQEASLAAMEDGERYRYLGELLTTTLFRVSPGDTEVEVVDFFSPEERTIKIPLDPSLNPAANAQAYFTRYRKAKKGKPLLEKKLKSNQQELAYLEGIALALEDASTPAEVEAIQWELANQGYSRKQVGKKRNQGREDRGRAPQPETFISQDGYTILVGKNNQQNDYLTRRLARAQDYWFHAKDIPGSHVLVPTVPQEQPPPASTLEEAAILAAFFSKGRDSSKVPVDYTLAKHVRKPKGARPGMVIYDHHKTLFVTPSKEKVENLKKRKGN